MKKKMECMVIVVEFIDGETVESDTAYREDIILEMKKQYPNESDHNLENALDEHVQNMIEVTGKIEKLEHFRLTVDGHQLAIRPSLIKTIHFKVEYQE